MITVNSWIWFYLKFMNLIFENLFKFCGTLVELCWIHGQFQFYTKNETKSKELQICNFGATWRDVWIWPDRNRIVQWLDNRPNPSCGFINIRSQPQMTKYWCGIPVTYYYFVCKHIWENSSKRHVKVSPLLCPYEL